MKVLREIIDSAYELFVKIVFGSFVNNLGNVRTSVISTLLDDMSSKVQRHGRK